MNLERRIWILGNLAVFLLVLFSLRIVYWQLIRGGDLQPVALNPISAAAKYTDRQVNIPLREGSTSPDESAFNDLNSLPQPVLQRTMDLLKTIARGSIYDWNGRLLASDRLNEEGKTMRFYTEPSLAHVIGYVSPYRTGLAGLELAYNDTLLGINRPDAQLGRIFHQPITGSDLLLTIDSSLQRTAENALDGKAGAVIALDSHSGAVLAMVSNPNYDPNRVLDQEYVSGLLSNCGDDPQCKAPFLNRATQALYPPGSTWKTISLIASLDTGQVNPKTVFDFGEPLTDSTGKYYVYHVHGGGSVPDYNHTESQLSLEQSYAHSANAAFARIGDEMPADVMVEYARKFGFSALTDPFHLEIESSQAQLAGKVDDLFSNNVLRATTAIGQGELLATPLDMGMVVLSVLNDGKLPVPYFVDSVREPSGRQIKALPNRQVIRNLMKPDTARLVKQMMVTVVEQGSGGKAAIPGLVVGGKTGTAQVAGDAQPHAWFIGFAEGIDRGVVIVVVVENGGQGSQVSAPIFAQVAQAAMKSIGSAVPEIVPTPLPPRPTPVEELTLQAQNLGVAPLKQTQPVPQAQTNGVPPPEITRDPNKSDITLVSASCPITHQGPAGSGKFIWPTQYQGLSGTDFKAGHPGIDLSAPPGSAVFAADAGVVIFAGWTGVGYGNAVLVDHGNGYQTLYGHLSQVSINCGASVKSGQVIGQSGSTGNSTGPHLHFEVRVPGGWINPLTVLPLP